MSSDRVLILKAKTHKAKNRIATWGVVWKIIGENSHSWTIMSMNDKMVENKTPDSTRWVQKQNDPDFSFVD